MYNSYIIVRINFKLKHIKDKLLSEVRKNPFSALKLLSWNRKVHYFVKSMDLLRWVILEMQDPEGTVEALVRPSGLHLAGVCDSKFWVSLLSTRPAEFNGCVVGLHPGAWSNLITFQRLISQHQSGWVSALLIPLTWDFEDQTFLWVLGRQAVVELWGLMEARTSLWALCWLHQLFPLI